MKLCCINHNFNYECEKICRLFLPFEKIEVTDTCFSGDGVAFTEICDGIIKASLSLNGIFAEREREISFNQDDREKELLTASLLFECFAEITDYKPKWGILTGIRPTRLYSSVLSEKKNEEDTERYFRENFYVDDEKISLCRETYKSEAEIINLSKDNSFSLYVSIPFCPTRCSYCSFVSHAVEKATKLIDSYFEYLLKEIEITANIAKENNLRLETVYIGGGTPTTLSAQQLRKLIEHIINNFDFTFVREFTVEAGRPDTVTKEKLQVLKEFNVDRISINPQTMSDEVLINIGRAHTAKQTEDAFLLAREVGFNNINMDLIAGLPGDTLENFKATIQKLISLSPESITVHSLSMKRSSNMNVKGQLPEIEVGKIADEMVTYARNELTKAGILPYYMYRQSKTVGNLENIGYAVKGKECLYNIYIMDETHTILACGASAVTKLRAPKSNYIERIFNFKYPYEYINRFDEQIERKRRIGGFYTEYPHNLK
ncbi:MAG: coproporphyrinogen dehydrogenase HemZ [Ruminococcaceae bacterium]|nr:coproporphyrinogen dehydrogenase HemZ [Oscillospiraceae bacterium]